MPGVTHSPIWLSPSGRAFSGTALDDVPLWDPVTQEWTAGVAPGGAAAPFSTVRFVDIGTTVAPADQDGSAITPFSTIAAALASFPNPTVVGSLYIAPGDYTAEAPVVPATIGVVEFVAMGAKLLSSCPVQIGAVSLLGSIGVAVAGCQLASLTVNSVVAPVVVALRDSIVVGDVLDAGVPPTGWTAFVADTTIGGDVGDITSPVLLLELTHNEVVASIAGDLFLGGFGFSSFSGGGVGGTVNGAVNSTVVADFGTFSNIDTGSLTIRDSDVGGILGAANPVNTLDAFETRFVGDVTLGATSRLRGCTVLGQWTTPNTVIVDAWTRRSFEDTALPVAGGGGLFVQGRANTEIHTVALGAQGAGDLAFYDVVMTGELVTIAAGEAVTVQPTSDIAAAGAGAGFLAYAYVSGAGTVRIAIVGAVGAGNQDFVFVQAQ